jgi:hypothetical protein
MPNKLRRNKRGGSRISGTRVAKPLRAPDSVKDVLARASPALTRVSDQASRRRYWIQWLAQHLPADLTLRVTGVVEREDTLIVFAESAAWSARLRYLLQELEPRIKQARPAIQRVDVRVMPSS